MKDESLLFAREIRREFPMFAERDRPVIYLDNAATTQKPRAVIERLSRFYGSENANIHRGAYPLARKADAAHENARECVREWIGAGREDGIVFTKSSTEAMNLVANSLYPNLLREGDNILVTEMEHSSNFFPWQHICDRVGCEFRVMQTEPDGSLDPERLMQNMDGRTRLLAVTGMSNVTGYIPDIEALIREAHGRGVPVLVDASQLIAHKKIDVKKMDCDLLAFSGHKVYGPMGIGVLYGKKEIMEKMSPFLYGGDMVLPGDGGAYSFREDPGKYEAGTQNIAGALGLAAALEWLKENDFSGKLLPYEGELFAYLQEKMAGIPGIVRTGSPRNCEAIFGFTAEGCSSYDIGIWLAASGIAVRTGGHCAYPLMRRLGIESSVRVSIAFYNTKEEIDLLTDRLQELMRKLAG